MLMYNRDSVLPIDVKHNLDKDENKEKEMEMKNNHSISTFLMPSFHQRQKTTIADDATNNIKATQKKQKRDYDRRHMYA